MREIEFSDVCRGRDRRNIDSLRGLADMGTSRGDLFVVETGEFTAVKVNRREIRDHAHCFTVSATAAPTAMIQTPVSGTTVCANV